MRPALASAVLVSGLSGCAAAPAGDLVWVDREAGQEVEVRALKASLPPMTADDDGVPWTTRLFTLRNAGRGPVSLRGVRAVGAPTHVGLSSVLASFPTVVVELSLPLRLEPGTEVTFPVYGIARGGLQPPDAVVDVDLRFGASGGGERFEEPVLSLRLERVPGLCPSTDGDNSVLPVTFAGQVASVQRTVSNRSTRPLELAARLSWLAAPPGTTAEVIPAQLRLEPGQSGTLTLRATTPRRATLLGTLSLVGPPGCSVVQRGVGAHFEGDCVILTGVTEDGGLALTCTPVGARSTTTFGAFNGCGLTVDAGVSVEGLPGTSARFVGPDGSPLASLGRNARGTLEVDFTPTDAHHAEGTVRFGEQVFSVEAEGVGPRPVISPAVLDFGVVPLSDDGGWSAPQFVSVANLGTQRTPPVPRCDLGVRTTSVSVVDGLAVIEREVCTGDVAADGGCQPFESLVLAPDAGARFPVRLRPRAPGARRWTVYLRSGGAKPLASIDVTAEVVP